MRPLRRNRQYSFLYNSHVKLHTRSVQVDASSPSGFSGLPPGWADRLAQAKFTQEEVQSDGDAILDVLRFQMEQVLVLARLISGITGPALDRVRGRLAPTAMLESCPAALSLASMSCRDSDARLNRYDSSRMSQLIFCSKLLQFLDALKCAWFAINHTA